MSDKAGPTSRDNLDGDLAAHGNALVEGTTTALSWLTVVPLKGASVFDRITGRRAIAAAPVAGVVPAAAAVFITAGLWALSSVRTAPLYDVTSVLAGALIMVAAQLLTRGMHLDGLADVTDALASYKPPEGAREVLRDPNTGPMAVGAIALTMLTSASGFAVLVAGVLAGWGEAVGAAGMAGMVGAAGMTGAAGFDGAAVWDGLAASPWRGLIALCLPFVAARAAAVAACWRGFPPFSNTGFGGLVAGTQSTFVVACWWIGLGAAAGVLIGVPGIVACALSLAAALLLTRHCVKRFGGVNGDVLGAVIEIACAVCVVTLAVGL